MFGDNCIDAIQLSSKLKGSTFNSGKWMKFANLLQVSAGLCDIVRRRCPLWPDAVAIAKLTSDSSVPCHPNGLEGLVL